MSNEVETLREHAADVVGQIIGPDETIFGFAKRTGFWATSLRDAVSGDVNIRIDSLARYAEANGLRVKMTLERIE